MPQNHSNWGSRDPSRLSSQLWLWLLVFRFILSSTSNLLMSRPLQVKLQRQRQKLQQNKRRPKRPKPKPSLVISMIGLHRSLISHPLIPLYQRDWEGSSRLTKLWIQPVSSQSCRRLGDSHDKCVTFLTSILLSPTHTFYKCLICPI